MKQIVLFGAGIYAEKYKSLLDFLDLSIDFFSDNDQLKLGQTLYQKAIIEPNKLKELDCHILISSTHYVEIVQQLTKMGIEDKIIRLEDLAVKLKERLDQEHIAASGEPEKEQTVILDMYEGDGWGGTEMWAATAAKGLESEGKTVILFGSESQPPLSEEYECMVERFPNIHTFEKMVKSMVTRLPFVLINNFSGYAYMIAVMLKKIYPGKVEIVSVIHNDDRSLYNAHMAFAEDVDKFICVSDKIRSTMIQEYGLNEKKVFFKEQPIKCDENFKRSYRTVGCPIRIGYAARLVKKQKRADLFPELINYLESEEINYELSIAGEGECFSRIKEFLQKADLKGKVALIGRVPKTNMPEFWKQQDIFLNFSEFEGTSFSMLEAMSYGCVPVVTDVSGVSEFIREGMNGYVCEVGDLKGIAGAIKCLDANRGDLQIFGEYCRNEVLTRCRIQDYIDFLCDTIWGA